MEKLIRELCRLLDAAGKLAVTLQGNQAGALLLLALATVAAVPMAIR